MLVDLLMIAGFIVLFAHVITLSSLAPYSAKKISLTV